MKDEAPEDVLCPQCHGPMTRHKAGKFKNIQHFFYRCLACRRVKRRAAAREARLKRGGWPTSNRSDVNNLNDAYVRKILSEGTLVPKDFWPDNIVNLKRNLIRLHRALLSL